MISTSYATRRSSMRKSVCTYKKSQLIDNPKRAKTPEQIREIKTKKPTLNKPLIGKSSKAAPTITIGKVLQPAMFIPMNASPRDNSPIGIGVGVRTGGFQMFYK